MGSVLIHSARQLLTLHGTTGPRRGPALNQLGIIADGAVLIEGDRIREVGPTRRIENLAAARNAREISAAGRVVMPGFVDSHTHLLSGPSRFEADTPWSGDDYRDTRIYLRNVPAVRETSARRLTAEAVLVLRQCLAHGTTTIEAKSGYALNASGELKLLRVLTALGDSPLDVVPTFFGAHVAPPDFDGGPDGYIRWLTEELLPAVHKRGLARFVDGCCDTGAFTAGELRPYFQRAAELGFALKLHASQLAFSDGPSLVGSFPFTSIDHLEHARPECIAAIAQSGTVATLTPSSGFFLRQQHAPARELIAAGVPIAVASNFNRLTSPAYNMQIALFLACHDVGLTPAEAISATTINGAHALKLAHRIGSLEAGKQADLLILRVRDYRELAYEFGTNLVSVTVKNGAVVFDSSGVKWPARS